jgi:hypothetical protein
MQRARYNTELLQPNFLKLTLSNLLGSLHGSIPSGFFISLKLLIFFRRHQIFLVRIGRYLGNQGIKTTLP